MASRALAGAAAAAATAAYIDDDIRRSLMVAVGGTAVRTIFHSTNTVHVHNEHHLHDALRRRDGAGLLTVSNHISTIDDPALLSAIVPQSSLLRGASHFRWAVCAHDVCFKPGSWLNIFAAASQTLPIVRGAGVWQPQVDAIIDKLRAGRWVHYFPEGKIRQDGAVHLFRRGVGRIVAEALQPPPPAAAEPVAEAAARPSAATGIVPVSSSPERLVVLPFYHEGNETIQPTSPTSTAVFSKRPGTGVDVHVIFGAPLDLTRYASMLREPAHARAPERLFELVAKELEEEARRLKRELHRRRLEMGSSCET